MQANIIIRRGGLGDFILTLPVLRALSRQSEPLYLVSRPQYHCLIPEDVVIDYFMDIDAAWSTAFYSNNKYCSTDFRAMILSATVYMFGQRDETITKHLKKIGSLFLL